MNEYRSFVIRFFLIAFPVMSMLSCSDKKEEPAGYRLESLPLSEVEIKGGLWASIYETSEKNTLPHEIAFLESTGRTENFSRAAGISEGPFRGERYNDSDVYKVIEGISYHLMHKKDTGLEYYTDSIISLIAAAQEDNGYIYTLRTINPDAEIPGAGSGRWNDVLISHELYNAGHLYEAAVAYYLATGKRSLLDVAIKNADLVISLFNDQGIRLAPGHQEIEIGLVKLAGVTGDERYLEQARFFLDQRGGTFLRKKEEPGTRFEIYNEPSYMQYHLPVREQKEAVGHAVRAVYMYSGMTDVGVLTGDKELLNAVDRLWNNISEKKIYLTGGIGASGKGEAFGNAYELPNATAYCETCAAAGSVFWNSRLFNYSADPKYMDLLETILYNGFLSGISLDGTRFFYPNPLESDGTVHRSEWFGVACCPSNIMRTVPEVPSWIYSKGEDALYVNLFIESAVHTTIKGTELLLEQYTNYPWEGRVLLKINPEKEVRMNLNIRIPGWTGKSFIPGNLYQYRDKSNSEVHVLLNGKEIKTRGRNMVSISKKWKAGDRVELEFTMPVHFAEANSGVSEDRDKLALVRGPLVYAFEGIDNEGDLDHLTLDESMELNAVFDPAAFNGATVIVGKGFKAIPYFLWDNRAPSKMKVWIPLKH